MLIKIESVYGDVLLSGKVSSIGQLKYRMMKILNKVEPEDFTAIFCACYKYGIYPHDTTLQVDYIIDLDTHGVYRPNYIT